MATATLSEAGPVDGGATAYSVETWPYDDPPFHGPDDRDWNDFRLTSEGATFEWRTPADRVRRAAERVVRGECSLPRAVREDAVKRWAYNGDHQAEFIDAREDEADALSSLSTDKLARRLLVEEGLRLTNQCELYSPYLEDDDAFLADCLEALDLPDWAEVQELSDGGPGTGFTNARLVLSPGKDLSDLSSWLAVRAARSPAQVDFLPWPALATRGRLGLTHQPGQFGVGRSTIPEDRLTQDLRVWKRAYRASAVVTLVDRAELANLGRIDLAARRVGLSWSHLPIPDRYIPASIPETARRAGMTLRRLTAGETVIVHCKAGLGRSGLFAACVLVASGADADAAIAAVREARPGAVEDPAQEAFVQEFAECRSVSQRRARR